jgi:hypothetical protein
LGCASACTEVRGEPAGNTAVAEATTGDAMAADSTGLDASSEGSSGADAPGPKLDIGADDTSDPPSSGSGCQAIDFLFVIDNSNSMLLYQQKLAAAVPGFVSALAQLTPTDDYRVMVVDTDAERMASYPCADEACCEYVCEHGNPQGPCDGEVCSGDPPSFSCDDTMGAGIVKAPDGAPCAVTPGTRWLQPDAPDFADAFACMALIGSNAYWQWPAAAIVQAVAPELQGEGGCNEGFLRDDALLVVVWLGDEDEPLPGDHPWPSAGDPDAWYDALVAAKGGNPDGVAMIAIAYDPSPMLGEVVSRLGDNGFFASIGGDHALAFANALATIDLACDDYVPAG